MSRRETQSLPADRDAEFLQREDLRAIRLHLEYLKSEIGFREAGVRSTVVLFGGARIPAPHDARERLESLRRQPPEEIGPAAITQAEKMVELSRYFSMAEEFTSRLARWTRATGRDGEFVITTGGGPGIMEAGNRGAAAAGVPTAGLNIVLPHEQASNPAVSPELNFHFRYFAIRKLHLVQRARALVAFPGGFGTLDEVFTSLCLVQTGKQTRIPIVLVGRDFWSRRLDLEGLVGDGLITAEDRDLVDYADSAEEVFEKVIAGAGPESP